MNNNFENDIMRCVNCGQELYQDEKFCRNCGTKIERQAETDTMICRNCGGVVKKGLFCIQCGHKAENEPTVDLASISTNEINGMNSRAGVINTSALLDRAYIALADKEWGAAYNFCEQVLNQEPQCADAYIVQLLSALKCGCRSDLSKLDKPFDDLLSYKKAIRFADETSQNELIGYNNIIRERNILEAAEEEKRLTDKKNEELYLEACSLIIDNENALKKAQDLFINLGNYKDSSNKADECINRLEVLRKNTVYTDACRNLINGTTDSVQYAMKSFESIIDWKDSAAKIDECKNKLARIEELQYESEQAECELADSFKKKKIIKFSLIAVGIIVILVPVLLLVLPAVSRSKEKKSEQTKYTDDSMELSGESSDILCFFDPETGKYLMENDKLRFEMDENTTQFSVTYKETDTVWSTNEKSPIVSVGMEKDYSGYVEGSFDTRNAVEKNKYGKLSTTIDTEPFVMTAINDECIQVEYELSTRDVSFIIPEVITEDRFFSFVDKLSDKEKKQILEYYRKYDKDNLKASDNYDELRILYPAIETDIIYVLRDTVKDYLRQKIAEMLAGAGYTEDDYKQDLKGSDIEYSIVRATIEYKLDNGDFIATVKNIEWDFDDYSGVIFVSILPGFGISAASEYSEIPMREEYIRIPENYMTDIHFDELCENQIGTKCCYPDTYNQTGINVVDDMKNMDFDFYPYFGISNNGQTVICCPETYISSVWINYSEDYGSRNSYDAICLDYSFDSALDSDFCISYQKNSEISQRYIFINGDDAETIRNAYNDYLFPENRRNTDEIPNLKENQDPEATYQTAIDMVKAGRMKEAASLLRTIMAGLFVSPMKAEAATKAKVVLEFTDGTKKTWKTGDKKIELGKKTLAYVYFGEYPQTEVTGKKLTKAIKNAKYDKNGIATVKGVKYKRITKEDATYAYDSTTDGDWYKENYYDWAGKTYAYFRLEPIKWRVLSNKKGTVLLMSEYGLDERKYNSEWGDITWADCTLRSWLNSDFLTSAFNAKERKLIKTTKVKNNDNPYYGTEGGKDTKDKVFLLSLEEMVNTKYGFASDEHEYDISRRCSSTDYAKAMGAYTEYSEENRADAYKTKEGKWTSWWWLRSPGYDSYDAAHVSTYGVDNGFGSFVDFDYAVRPALQLNLSSVIG